MLKIHNLYKSFGEQQVLQGLDMQIDEGKIHTLIGGNGTGKTTLFNLITGFLRADDGKIVLNEKNLNHLSPVAVNAEGITRTFQDLRLITQLSVKENILLACKNNPGEKLYNALLPSKWFQKEYKALEQKTDEILEKVHLAEVTANLAGEISYGQQKLLTIGCCLANNAELLLLDEPVAGIDKDNYYRIYELLVNLKKEGKTVLQIEHNHNFVESLSDGIWYLHAGKALFFSKYDDFIHNDLVKETYLN